MGGRGTLPYRDGYLELTDSHLFVVRDGYLAESLALRHLSDVTLEEAHSFRHRIWGVVAAVALFAPAALALIPEDLAGGLALLAMFRGKVLIDLRNVYDRGEVEEAGLIHYGIGRGAPKNS